MSKYITLNEQGLLDEIDLHTGEVRCLNPNKTDIQFDETRYDKVRDKDGNIVYILKGSMDPDSPPREFQGTRGFPYSPLLADRICEEIASGAKITKICEKEGYPSYGQLLDWRRKYPEFDEKIRQARKDRAEYYFDKAVEQVESTPAARDEIQRTKVVSDFYKNAAKLTSPENFTDKVEVGGSIGVQIASVETGIRRPGDEGFDEKEVIDIKDSGDDDVGMQSGVETEGGLIADRESNKNL